jgi:hypothetical protein
MQSTAPSCDPLEGLSAAAIQARLREVTSAYTYRQLGATASCHPESVRRWLMTETRPPIWFIVSLCDALHLNPHWVLTGQGPTHHDPDRMVPLAATPPRLLLERLAQMLDTWSAQRAAGTSQDLRLRSGSGQGAARMHAAV